MRILFIFLIFILMGAFFIISNENLHLKNADELEVFRGLYYNWFESLFNNAKSLTGYVVDSQWLPSSQNSSN